MLLRRELGATGLQVSVLGYGASALGGVFQDIDEDEGVASVHHAFSRGVNVFDVSPFYGLTKAETVLGRALRDLPRSEIVVATKVGRYGTKQFDFSAARVTESVRESLERLQLSYIDIIQCHDIEFGDLDQVVGEALPALARLKAAGLVRHVGITGLPLAVFNAVLDRVPPGTVETVMSYCHYCLNDTTLAASIPYLQAKGVGVMNASPLCMGLLTRQGPPAWHPAPEPLRAAARQAADHAAAAGFDIATLGIKYSLRNEAVATTFVSMNTRHLVDANVSACVEALGGADVAPEQAQREEQVLREVLGAFAPVKDVSWPSGKWPAPAAAGG